MRQSPYLTRAARRASLQIVTAPTAVTPITDLLKTDYHAEHFRFARHLRPDNVPLERTRAIEPLWHSWLAGICIVAAIAIVWVVL